jgi:hypothetical protein
LDRIDSGDYGGPQQRAPHEGTSVQTNVVVACLTQAAEARSNIAFACAISDWLNGRLGGMQRVSTLLVRDRDGNEDKRYERGTEPKLPAAHGHLPELRISQNALLRYE